MDEKLKKLAERIDQQYLDWAIKAYEEETGNFFSLATNEERELVIYEHLRVFPPTKES